MNTGPYRLVSALSILLFAATNQAHAQTPQRDNRPRTASISGRVTVAGKPAVNAAVTITETDLRLDGVAASGMSDNRVPFSGKTRTDSDGRYLITGLAQGRYVVGAVLKAFIIADRSADPSLSRTVTLDEGEAREKIDFALIRGGVISGKVLDDEGRPMIAKRLQLYAVDEQGRKNHYQGPFIYESSETDDRGAYRIFGLPPGRYIISAGGEGGGDPLRGGTGKFALTYHPDTTDEKQARVFEVKEESEVADVDIRFGNAKKTYEAAGRVLDGETGKPVPRVSVFCVAKSEKDASFSGYSTTAIVDHQGNFRLPGLPAGRYQARILDSLSETGYTGDITEFEITNDNISGIEVKAFLGASVSGVVTVEGGDATVKNSLQQIMIEPNVRAPRNSADAATESYSTRSYMPARVSADGSFTIKGLLAGQVSFSLMNALFNSLQIKRIERDGVELREAVDVRPGEKITGVRIVVFQANGRIRGQVQIVGGKLPDEWRLQAYASRPSGALDEDWKRVASFQNRGGFAEVDEKGRFVLEALPAGEYEVSVFAMVRDVQGGQSSLDSPRAKERVTVRENDETAVTITLDLARKEKEDRR